MADESKRAPEHINLAIGTFWGSVIFTARFRPSSLEGIALSRLLFISLYISAQTPRLVDASSFERLLLL